MNRISLSTVWNITFAALLVLAAVVLAVCLRLLATTKVQTEPNLIDCNAVIAL